MPPRGFASKKYRLQIKKYLHIYLIICDEHVQTPEGWAKIKFLLESKHVTACQVRFKTLIWADQIKYGIKIRNWAWANDIKFIVNDNNRLALIIRADAVHLGWDDINTTTPDWIPTLKARLFNLPFGLSISTAPEMQRALELYPSYLSFGAVHPTTSKKDYHLLESFDLVKEARLKKIPFVFIGGLNDQNITDLFCYRPNGFCFIAFLLDQPKNIFLLDQVIPRSKKPELS